MPGLLVSFARRYDDITGSMKYFPGVLLGYAFGLLLANVCVVLMNYGQPALLYLVPCTLGSFALMGHFDGRLKELWGGPVLMRRVDESENSNDRMEMSNL